MFLSCTSHLGLLPGESFFVSCLQQSVIFSLNNKIIKRGKMILFRRVHYFIQFAFLTEKGTRENFEIPIPFNIETHEEEGLMYLDYRPQSLKVENLPRIPDKVSCNYFNKILEMQIVNTCTLACL